MGGRRKRLSCLLIRSEVGSEGEGVEIVTVKKVNREDFLAYPPGHLYFRPGHEHDIALAVAINCHHDL